MSNFVSKLISLLLVLFFSFSLQLYSQQTSVSGNVTDGSEALIGVNILVKGKVIGTISDKDGNFSLNVNSAPPLTLVFSIVGYETQEIEVNDSNSSDISVTMLESTMLGKEIVVSASRVAQNILEAPVTIEKMDLLAIQNSATADFIDQLEHIKGVKVSRGSLNFPAINTRGFATDANTRFVQLVDGMDTSAPLLNFPTGNLVGINPLDLESVELIPGSSSALYGPNAYNGTMLMASKSPFEYQGLSVQVTQGMTSSEAQGDNQYLYSKYNIRYAKAFNDKFAIKVNFSYDEAQDWAANDYSTHRAFPDSTVNLSGQPNFDGMNVYGDEIQIIFPASLAGPQYASYGLLDLRRTGFPEEFLLDYDASTAEYAQFAIAMPKSWNLGTVTFQYFWAPSNTNTGNCIMGLQGVSVSNDDTADVVFGTAQEVTDAGGGAVEDVLVSSVSSAMTIAGTPADDDLTFFQLYRDAADGSDTFTGDARLLGIKLFYTTDAANDA